MKMNDNPKILKCKILHLKAIELVARFMPNSNLYVSHLISSFNKNYKFYMEKIVKFNLILGWGNIVNRWEQQLSHFKK